MIRILTTILLLVLFVCNSNAQMSRLYTMDQGLTTTRISSSYIDNDGLLWLMGDRSLSFFDGNRFHTVLDEKSAMANKVNIIYSMQQVGENSYLVGTGLGLFLFNSKTYQFDQISLDEPKGKNHMPGYPVSAIVVTENKKHVIITTSGFGSFVLRLDTFEIDKEMTKAFCDNVQDKFVYTVLVTQDHEMWISTSIDPLVRINTKTFKALPVNMDEDLKKQIVNHTCPIVCMREDAKTHNVLMGSTGLGLLIYDKKADTVRETMNNKRNIVPCDIVYTKLGDVFIGSDNVGILQYDRNEEVMSPVNWEVRDVDLKVCKVHHFSEDVDGNLIASLYHKGVLVVSAKVNKMNYMPVSRTGNGRNSSPVSGLFSTGNMYWIATDGSGMFTADAFRFSDMKNVSAGLNLAQMTSVVSDANGNVWSSSYGGGLQMFDGTQWVTPSYVSELSTQNVLSLVSDKKTNRLYVCINGNGLWEVDINAQTSTKLDLPEIGNRWVAHGYIDPKRNLWVMFANGLCYYNLETHKAKHLELSNINNAQINDMAYFKGKMYFGTTQGLVSYDYKTGVIGFEQINGQFSEQDIVSILPEKDDIWLALSHSISRVSNNGKTVTNYTSFQGFYIGEFHQRSRVCSNDGFVCFGGDNGIVAIATNNDNETNALINKLIITGLSVNGDAIVYNPDSEDNILDCSILSADHIRLKSNQNAFSISFGSTEYANSEEIVYEYQLDGYEDIWHTASANSASAYYSSVPSGNYVFRIRAHYNYSDEFIEKSIEITIEYPWYSTWWAFLIYFVIAAAIGWYLWKMYKERKSEKAKVRQLQHDEQIKEAKLRLFTSIAHELRTPLTMIISPLKQLKVSDQDTERHKLYEVMQRNCDRLLNIVKQITDVRKIDNGQLHLHFSEVEFVRYCKEIMESFSGMSAAKHIQFNLFCDVETLNIWVDPVHFEKVLINLLSNAFKFTPMEGKILIRTERKANVDATFADKRITEYMCCSIFNSGSHIDERDIDHIYERFYQGTANSNIVGSGIGLNLTYELVKLHHGIIKVQNIENDGVEFTILIPMGKEHLTAEELKPRESESTTKTEQESTKAQIDTLTNDIVVENKLENQEFEEVKKKKHLLIVDDDREICEYMRTQLEDDYNITISFSGNAAWKQVLSIRPDVVITDFMMPDGDGCELSQRIKQNPETAHIPVIMLTAESNEQSRLQSMSADVDQFLTKPFNIVLLKGALGQVLRVRENLMNKKNRTEIQHDYTEMEMDSYEDKFYNKINEIIKKNLDDSNFTVEGLAREVGISRVHLNRKLKEHYGVSPNAFIRSVRLKQAAYLLVNNKVNISEVAYKVGFASHSYFSNNFHDYFGMTPTEFVAYYSNKVNDEQLKKLLE